MDTLNLKQINLNESIYFELNKETFDILTAGAPDKLVDFIKNKVDDYIVDGKQVQLAKMQMWQFIEKFCQNIHWGSRGPTKGNNIYLYDGPSVNEHQDSKFRGYSVRLVKDAEPECTDEEAADYERRKHICALSDSNPREGVTLEECAIKLKRIVEKIMPEKLSEYWNMNEDMSTDLLGRFSGDDVNNSLIQAMKYDLIDYISKL